MTIYKVVEFCKHRVGDYAPRDVTTMHDHFFSNKKKAETFIKTYQGTGKVYVVDEINVN